MSDNKKYYYLKLKEDYFNKDNVKVLESMENGYIYSVIILKLYLKALKYSGQLMMTERIPYNPDKVEILASVIHHDVSHVKDAIRHASDLDIVTVFDSGEMWMNEIQDFIGHSNTEADRKKLYRKKLKLNKIEMGHSEDKRQDKRPLELEREKELKKDIEREKEPKKQNKIVPPQKEWIENRIKEMDYSTISVDSFMNHYNSNGWKVGKNKMVCWHSALAGWESREKKKREPIGKNINPFEEDRKRNKEIVYE